MSVCGSKVEGVKASWSKSEMAEAPSHLPPGGISTSPSDVLEADDSLAHESLNLLIGQPEEQEAANNRLNTGGKRGENKTVPEHHPPTTSALAQTFIARSVRALSLQYVDNEQEQQQAPAAAPLSSQRQRQTLVAVPAGAPQVPENEVIHIDGEQQVLASNSAENEKKRTQQYGRQSPLSKKARPLDPPPASLTPRKPPAAAAQAPSPTNTPASRAPGGTPESTASQDNQASLNEFTGPFVTEVLSGRFIEYEHESNRKRALDKVKSFATRNGQKPAPPDKTITLTLEQAQSLSDSFLNDRHYTVFHAVRMAHGELKSKHEELMEKVLFDSCQQLMHFARKMGSEHAEMKAKFEKRAIKGDVEAGQLKQELELLKDSEELKVDPHGFLSEVAKLRAEHKEETACLKRQIQEARFKNVVQSAHLAAMKEELDKNRNMIVRLQLQAYTAEQEKRECGKAEQERCEHERVVRCLKQQVQDSRAQAQRQAKEIQRLEGEVAELKTRRRRDHEAETRHARSLNAMARASIISLRQLRKRASPAEGEED